MFSRNSVIVVIMFILVGQSLGQAGKKTHLTHELKLPVDWEGDMPEIDFVAESAGNNEWLLRVGVTNFEFTPKNTGQAHRVGQGHMHLFVDGKKTTRLYGQPYFLSGLDEGERKLRVTLNSNDHRDYHINGHVVSSELTIMQSKSHLFRNMEEKELLKDPGLIVRVIRDPMHGWNIFIDAAEFDFSKGWAELSINGQFRGRVYGGYHYLADFLPERDSLTVNIRDEEGRVCLFDGMPVEEILGKAHQLRWFASGLNTHPINRRNGLPEPEMELAYDKETIYVNSNGIPTFQFVQQTPNPIEPQINQWKIPRFPVVAKELQQIPLLGTVAVLTVGLPIYGPNEAQHPHPFGDPYINEVLDFCHGHTAGRGDYHFHYAPTCLLNTPDGNEEHYNIVGFSLDGYPIVAHYLSVLDNDGKPILNANGEFQFNWQEVSGYEPSENYRRDVLEGQVTSTYVWENYNYQPGREGRTLDECNGRQLKERAMADGTIFDERDFFKSNYAYFLTGEFPYVLAKYKGEAKDARGRRTYNRDGSERRRDSSRRRGRD